MSNLRKWRAPAYKLSLPIPEDLDVNDPEVIAAHTVMLRGLGLNDITQLINMHQAEMVLLFSQLVVKPEAGSAEKISLSLEESRVMSTTLLATAPTVAGDIIALAADDPEGSAAAMALPFPLQIEALDNIGRMTFDAQGGPKKVIEIVTRILGGITSLLQGASAKKLQSL